MCLIRQDMDILTPLEVQRLIVLLDYIRLNKCYIQLPRVRQESQQKQNVSK